VDFEMSWIDRINAAIVRRIHGKAALRADDQGVELSGQRLMYADLRRAVAYRHPNLIGDDLAIALDFGEGLVVVVSENDAGWRTVVAAINAHPRSRRPSTEWRLALVGGVPEERVELLTG
jgi:hypothetical protein